MFPVGDTMYPLCLLDTMAVSEMAKRPNPALVNFYSWVHKSQPLFVPCFSVFTLIELRRKPDLFSRFIDQFHPLPCVLIKGYEELLQEEVAAYPDPSGIDPCALAFTPFGGDGNLLSNLPNLLQDPHLLEREQYWNAARREIVDGMISLVGNFPPAEDKYTAAEIREFIEMAGFSQLVYRAESFAKQLVDREEAAQIDAFPSLKASLYTAFHKFYVDPTRKPVNSDAFDIIISASVPYVEAIITENHQAEVLRKTKRRDDFIGDLRVFTLRDFRQTPPT
jgi:hypothetical protein